MDREIKFRALTNCGVEVYGYYVHDEHLKLHYIDTGKGVRLEIKIETLGQYTGLKDKNGKEIYEGDIVKYTDGEIVRRTGAIEFDCWGFMLNEIGGMQVGLLGEIDDFEEFAFEVIGNIYENPELLNA